MPHHVAVGALVGPRGVLLAHRRADEAYYPDCWDFPGGHIEPGESAAEALACELREEIGCTATVTGEPRLRIAEDEAADDGLVLALWVITDWIGEPTNRATDEHDDVRWVSGADLESLTLAHPAYVPLLRELVGTV